MPPASYDSINPDLQEGDDEDDDDEPIGDFSQPTFSQTSGMGGDDDDDNDHDDGDGNDDDDDDSDDDGSIDGQTSILNFRLLESLNAPQIRSYRSLVNVRHSTLLLNLESFLYGPYADELSNFLSVEFLRQRSVMRVWIHVNVEFTEESDDGVLTTVAPFAQSPFYVRSGF